MHAAAVAALVGEEHLGVVALHIEITDPQTLFAPVDAAAAEQLSQNRILHAVDVDASHLPIGTGRRVEGLIERVVHGRRLRLRKRVLCEVVARLAGDSHLAQSIGLPGHGLRHLTDLVHDAPPVVRDSMETLAERKGRAI